MATKINRLTHANVYLEGVSFLGRCDKVTLPTIKQMMDDHKAMGMVSSIELPARGVDKMEAKFLWSSIYPEVIKATSNPTKSVNLQVRASLDEYTGAGLTGESGYVVSLGGIFKEKPLGEIEKQKGTTVEDTMAVHYVKAVIDGEELIEIDVLNNIYKVVGEDILSRFRQLIGA